MSLIVVLSVLVWYVYDSVTKCKIRRSKEILDHLNSIEPDHIKFTMEEEEDNRLPVLDLALMVNRKTKKIEFTVHYKKTHTHITIKKNSNHRDSTKSGVIKGEHEDKVRLMMADVESGKTEAAKKRMNTVRGGM